ncbi:MAG: tRNA lysidine(34) synthetase TilS [Rhodobacteraceae bacterium]|nr:tRNA lysidine(34) synthetase TilS [Paracoccaceae bacterium]
MDILAQVRAKFHASIPTKLGIAVSGGGDSTALMHILANCFEPGQVELSVATVDHGLRSQSSDESRDVAAQAASLGIAHQTLRWEGWDGTGNLSDQARRARYRLLSEWAKSQSIAMIAVGHTADDQAETVMMRLIRAAGVTGLSAMPVRRTLHGITIFRPLLDISRDELRDFLRLNKITWFDDPSNDDERFDRIKVRRALEALAPLGLTSQALSQVAQNMAQAREALDWYSFLAARDLVTIVGGNVVLCLRKFRTLPDEVARRLFMQAMMWISGAEYPPRRAPLLDALNKVRQGDPATLSGCRVVRQARSIWICREHNAVRRKHVVCGEVWDGRWQLSGGDAAGCEVRPLGEQGLRMNPNWRDIGSPNAALMASPSVWRGDDLVAAPLAGMANGWTAELVGGEEEFYASLLSH